MRIPCIVQTHAQPTRHLLPSRLRSMSLTARRAWRARARDVSGAGMLRVRCLRRRIYVFQPHTFANPIICIILILETHIFNTFVFLKTKNNPYKLLTGCFACPSGSRFLTRDPSPQLSAKASNIISINTIIKIRATTFNTMSNDINVDIARCIVT